VYLIQLGSIGVVVLLAGTPEGAVQAIDTEKSSITIHVGKAGLFALAAHEHWVDAAIASGTIDVAAATPSVLFTVDARKLVVKAEHGVSDKDQAEVQANMQTKVLESSKYPEIAFPSTHVRRDRHNAWKVSGDLRLHGVTRSITFDVTGENDAYAGAVRIKQTDFGIEPIKIGGGVVKVKDELEISFRVYALAH
jgi:YceI-like domain